MRDDPRLVDQIQRDLRDVRWPEPQEIRYRARRRSQRTAMTAAVAVLTLVGVSAFVVTGNRGEVAPPPVAASAAPTAPPRGEIVVESLLQSADLAQSARMQLSESGLTEPVLVEHMLGRCRESQGMAAGWATSHWSRSQTLLRDRAVDSNLRDVLLRQDVYRVAPGAAASFFGDLDRLVAPCAEWRSLGRYDLEGVTGTTEVTHRWTVVQRGFAGDGAALLRHTWSEARDRETGRVLDTEQGSASTAVVRVGDLITVLSLAEDGTEPELRQLANVAARRMCAAANPAC